MTDEIEDGKDDQGNPKKKKVHWFEQTKTIGPADSTILCFDVGKTPDGLVRFVAGLQDGKLLVGSIDGDSPRTLPGLP